MPYVKSMLRKKIFYKIVYSMHPFREIDNADQYILRRGQENRSMCTSYYDFDEGY